MVFSATRPAQGGRVLGDHLRVHRETPCGDDDRFRFDRTGFGEVFPRGTDHRAFVVQDQVGGPGLVSDLHSQVVGTFDQQVDHHGRTAEFAGHRHGVPARRRLGLLAEGPDLFVAGVAQAFGARRDNHFARVEAALELKTQVLQPIEVLDAAFAISADLRVVGVAGHRDQILVHLLRGVGVPGGLLHRGPAAEVEVPSGHCGGAAGRCRALQHQNPRPRSSCADRCAAAPDTETDHHDVDFVRPRRHVVSAESCWYFSAHWRRCSSSLAPCLM